MKRLSFILLISFYLTTMSSFASTWHVAISGSNQGGGGSVIRNFDYEDVTESNSNFQFCGSPNSTFIVNADILLRGTS